MESDTEEFKARPYQIDLYEKAIQKNTIIYLPTGGGKTFVAVMVIKKFSAEIQKLYSEGGKRSIFVVNTVALVLQQTKYITRHTGLTCNGYSGEMHVDFYSLTEWLVQFEKYQVLVMTSQILLDLLSHGRLSLDRINLIIFDECHSAVSDHPMRQIMRRFESCPKEQQPRVLALSACLLNSNVKLDKLNSTIKDLETTFLSTVASIDSKVSVEGYCTNPKESVVLYEPYESQRIQTLIQQKLDDINQVLACVFLQNKLLLNDSSTVFQARSKNSKLISIMLDVQDQLQQTGIYGCSKAVLLHLIQLERLKKNSDDMKAVHVLEYLITEMVTLRKILDNEMKDVSEIERIHRYSSDQVCKLLGILKDFHKNKLPQQKLCCIVFVEKRFTAKVLYHVLKNLCECDKEYDFLMPDFVVGFSNNPYKNSVEALCITKWNKEVLLRFRNGLSNCVIATEVVAEGIDLPNCSLIVRYNFPTNVRSYIQTKGRARHQTSKFVMLIPNNNNQNIQQHKTYKQTELYIEKLLLGKTNNRDEPTTEEIEQDLYSQDIPPYKIIDKHGREIIISALGAISIINRYVCALSRSNFVTLVPTWILHKVSSGYQVSMKLPTTSPVKEIFLSSVMRSIALAKRDVALKACKALYMVGELTDSLLPVDKVDSIKNIEYLFPNWIDENIDETRILGTTKKKRQHELQKYETWFK
ncbi:hypothetical protein KM043_018566 [Ampulex compressa]|nr:hypothetical protein KM043_018566 [Ampulex compressa]